MIETTRLLLRPLRTDDVDAYVALHADERVNQFVRSLDHDQALERLRRTERQWAERGHGLCAVELKESGEFIGRCGLNYWEQFDEIEIGYALKAETWGRGYATEAAKACLDWGFANLDAPYFTAMIQPANTASVRVAERLGFTELREDEFLGTPITVSSLNRAGQAVRQ